MRPFPAQLQVPLVTVLSLGLSSPQSFLSPISHRRALLNHPHTPRILPPPLYRPPPYPGHPLTQWDFTPPSIYSNYGSPRAPLPGIS